MFAKLRDFFNQGGFSAVLENFLAMIPATILMPIMVNNATGIMVFNISNVLLATGFGTALFIFITKRRMPGYLGSSFAYIGVTSYICQNLKGKSREVILSYVFGAYLFSAAVFVCLGILCRINEKKTNKMIDFLIPPAVMGPVVSLIGLELSPQAVEMANLKDGVFHWDSCIALAVVFLFVGFSLVKRRLLKNAAIFSAFAVVSAVCIFIGKWDISPMRSEPFFAAPEMEFIMPRFYLPFLVMIIPPTFIIFSEHIARKIMTDSLKNSIDANAKNTTLSNSIVANGSAFALSALLKGTPLTVYAENIAVMRINSFVNVLQFLFVCAFAIVTSFFGPALYLIQNIPTPIIGGLSLSLMGVIAVPGIKLLVDRQVNYNKISNLLLTSVVLIAGLSDVKVTILVTEFKGMSLGLLAGMALNLVIHLFTIMKWNREPFGIDDICDFARTFDGVIENTHSEVSNDIVVFRFYIGYVDDEKLFLQLTKSYHTWNIQVRTRAELTEEECKQLFNDFQAYPGLQGILQIEADRLNTRKKFEKVIGDSYDYVKGCADASVSKKCDV